MSSVLCAPSGQSHRTCRATVGQTPVSRCTWPASLNFSSVVVAAAGWINFPNRVPVLAKPQDGSSMRKGSSASKIFLLCRVHANLSSATSATKVTIIALTSHESSFAETARSVALSNEQRCLVADQRLVETMIH